MNILISKTNPNPIYEQIKRQIKQSILQGELTEGDLLPSVRKLAKELKVSVITTRRAYDDLEMNGYIESIVGKGTYVAKQDIKTLRKKQLIKLNEKIKILIEESNLIGLSLGELQALIDEAYKEEK